MSSPSSPTPSTPPPRPTPTTAPILPAKVEREPAIDYGAVRGILEGREASEQKSERGNGAQQASQDVRAKVQDGEDRPPQPQADPSRPALDIGDDDEEISAARKKVQGRSLAEFANEHQVSQKDVYGLLVDLGLDGEAPKTIGELKDHFRETRAFTSERDSFEDWKLQSQNEVRAARQQLETIMGRLVPYVGPEQMAQIFADGRQEIEQQQARQQSQLREYFPEWADSERQQKDVSALVSIGKTYGFDEQDIMAITDARLIRFGVHAARLIERYERLKKNGVLEKQPTTSGPSRKNFRPDKKQEAEAIASKGDVYGGVRKLLGG